MKGAFKMGMLRMNLQRVASETYLDLGQKLSDSEKMMREQMMEEIRESSEYHKANFTKEQEKVLELACNHAYNSMVALVGDYFSAIPKMISAAIIEYDKSLKADK